jgi:hypothetical protein
LSLSSSSFRLGDVDGDGRADACLSAPGDRRCVRSIEIAGTEEDRRPSTIFDARTRVDPFRTCSLRFPGEEITLADVDGDGRADVCASSRSVIACATVLPSGECGLEKRWSFPADGDAANTGSGDAAPGVVRFGDVDGDGRVDACTVSARAIGCALSSGNAFGRERPWAVSGHGDDDWLSARRASAVVLADVDGDGRADACGRGATGIVCARSTGRGFAHAETWTSSERLSAANQMMLGDVNGDRRADLCTVTATETASRVECGLSDGHRFTSPTVWLDPAGSSSGRRLVDAPSFAMGDVNGDGRADLCGYDAAGVVCALSP